MKCIDVRDDVSAYFDGELPLTPRESVQAHLQKCPDCSQNLVQLRRLSALAKDLPDPRPVDLWPAIERQLAEDKVSTIGKSVIRFRRFHWRMLAGIAAVAAALLVGVALLSNHPQRPMALPEMAVNLAAYVTDFNVDPQRAESSLLGRYNGKAVEPESIVKLVGYAPAAPNNLGEGLVRTAMYVIEMPCCKCIQSLYRRPDGSMLAVFEHEGDQPAQLGGQSSTQVHCAGRDVNLTDCDGQLCASWKAGDRFVTVVGVKDVNEATQLVPAFAVTKT